MTHRYAAAMDRVRGLKKENDLLRDLWLAKFRAVSAAHEECDVRALALRAMRPHLGLADR